MSESLTPDALGIRVPAGYGIGDGAEDLSRTIRGTDDARRLLVIGFAYLRTWYCPVTVAPLTLEHLYESVGYWNDPPSVARAFGLLEAFRAELRSFVRAGGIRETTGVLNLSRLRTQIEVVSLCFGGLYRALRRRLAELGVATDPEATARLAREAVGAVAGDDGGATPGSAAAAADPPTAEAAKTVAESA